MRKPLYIYGAGGLGREVLSLIKHLDEWEPRGFIDDGSAKSSNVGGLSVLGGSEVLRDIGAANVVIAVGHPLLRQRIAMQLPVSIESPVLVHPRATILDAATVKLGKGSIISAGAVLTCNIRLGDHVLVNLNATIGHDTSIGSYSSVMPGVNIAGEVTIEDCVLLGSGANVRNRVTLGFASQIGMGAVVLKDVNEGQTVVGIPARPLER